MVSPAAENNPHDRRDVASPAVPPAPGAAQSVEPLTAQAPINNPLLSASLPPAPDRPFVQLMREVRADMNSAGVSTWTILQNAAIGISAEGLRWTAAFATGVLGMQAAIDRSGSALAYFAVSYTLLLVSDQLDGIWRTRVDVSDRAYFRRLKERLLDTLGRSSLKDLSDQQRSADLELHLERAENISNAVEQSAAIPSYMTKVALSGGALLLTDWRIGLMVGLAVLPGLYLRSRQTREDLDLQERQARKRKVVDRIEEEVYRPEGAARMVLGRLRRRIGDSITQLQTALDHEKDAHERRQNRQLFLANMGYYGSLLGGVTLLNAQLQAGALAVGTFFFLCHQLQEFGEEIAAHGETLQTFRRLTTEASRFYSFTQPSPEQGAVPFPSGHHVSVHAVRFEREGFSVSVPELELEPGSLLIVKGGSGAGKTTLLEHLAFAARPAEGCVLIGGQPAHEIRFSEWCQQIAYCGARPTLLEGMTVRDVLRGNDLTDEHVAERLSHPLLAGLVERLNDSGGLDTRIGVGILDGRGFSTGELQRMALVSAVLPARRLLFIDEVTANQSEDFLSAFADLLSQQRALGTTVVFATHSKRFDASATRTLRVQAGVAELLPRSEPRLLSDGSADSARTTA